MSDDNQIYFTLVLLIFLINIGSVYSCSCSCLFLNFPV